MKILIAGDFCQRFRTIKKIENKEFCGMFDAIKPIVNATNVGSAKTGKYFLIAFSIISILS